MSFDSTAKYREKPRILVAPLDWGLGHATRCIPVIYELIKQGAEVWIAGEGRQVVLLKKEFPDLKFLPLKGYRIRYGRSPAHLLWSVVRQVPSILRAIKNENKWLARVVVEYGFNAIISDNRYGLHHKSIPSVFITHQLYITTPFGRWLNHRLQKINYRYIRHFTACWVPDSDGASNLAGELSHPLTLPQVPVQYTGILSRLTRTTTVAQERHLFISLSGPEPQRTYFEDRIVFDISRYNGTAVIVRGLPGEANLIPSTNDIRFYNHLPANEYNSEMEKAEWVISRSGYSTVMDLARVGKKSILVPTPGQPEQEYLAKYLEEKKFAVCISQKAFNLNAAIELARNFDYKDVDMHNTLPGIVDSFLNKIKLHQPADRAE